MTIGARIRTSRKKANLTQAELAKLIDVSPSSIRMYETNKRNVSLEILKKISTALNISISDLIGYDNVDKDYISINTSKNSNTPKSNSFTRYDYARKLIESYNIDFERTINQNDPSNNTLTINKVVYTDEEFINLIDELIEFLEIKIELKRRNLKNK
ncbi:helix-turn-helix domain-containing protein [Clostridium butyricum]|uniref:Helix-turn-helix domain protein n=1 Tax=Clostridium butyricum E4 str. BoNT E BL5262 TaxID=632245 RepID=C4IE43_CLOBU|nr:helix-turn-helix transcriptional regulator [Clostridium butyricum]EDT73979.1 putative phage repressor [Clostridium butyricum 5521]EEP55648.1 helix-turn-helix domain protein [Clostridium butyricum E4 str. BoNT E BL5262]NFL32150.1 helix-turn-helix transcriptional regulator [Clostridium butyricum]NFS19929.1 helix-turn-helix transcriptional regulator [Clostridium butyricum]